MTNDDECFASTLTRNHSNKKKINYNLISTDNGSKSDDHVINRQAMKYVGSRRLTCLVCSSKESVIHIDLEDNRRISYDAARPYCRTHDLVECYKNQDACFTIVQPSSFNSARIPIRYVITKGCTFKRKYISLGMGCHNNQEIVQGIEFDSSSKSFQKSSGSSSSSSSFEHEFGLGARSVDSLPFMVKSRMNSFDRPAKNEQLFSSNNFLVTQETGVGGQPYQPRNSVNGQSPVLNSVWQKTCICDRHYCNYGPVNEPYVITFHVFICLFVSYLYVV